MLLALQWATMEWEETENGVDLFPRPPKTMQLAWKTVYHLNILSVTVVQQELETRAKFLHSHRDIHPQFITRHYGNQESNIYQDPDSNSNGPPWS